MYASVNAGRTPDHCRCEVKMTNPDEKLSTDDAARHMGIAKATLAKMRCCGGSPPFLRLGRKILYVRADLDVWLNARRATSTSHADRLPRRLTDPDPAA